MILKIPSVSRAMGMIERPGQVNVLEHVPKISYNPDSLASWSAICCAVLVLNHIFSPSLR